MDKYPQLQDLRLFSLVVRHGSFVGAAREARASQTLLSKRVALLEKALGVQLLSRTTRKVPRSPSELTAHDCVLLRERAEPFGTWRLLGPRGPENVKVSGTLACNDIDVVLRWLHDGHGIVMSGDWLFQESLANGSLVRVLPEWRQPANVNAVTSTRSSQSAKVRIFLEYLREAVAPHFATA